MANRSHPTRARTKLLVRPGQYLILFGSPVALVDARCQMIEPSLPALLPQAAGHSLGHLRPPCDALVNAAPHDAVFPPSPRPFDQPRLQNLFHAKRNHITSKSPTWCFSMVAPNSPCSTDAGTGRRCGLPGETRLRFASKTADRKCSHHAAAGHPRTTSTSSYVVMTFRSSTTSQRCVLRTFGAASCRSSSSHRLVNFAKRPDSSHH